MTYLLPGKTQGIFSQERGKALFNRPVCFLDREFVASTESEKIFMKRFKEILKENEFDV